MAEIENLNRVIKRPKENPFNGTAAQIQEIIGMFKGNLKNKNVAGLTKCLDLIEKQTEKLVSKQKELTAKLDLIVRNTSEDIKRIKLEESRDEGFDIELTQTIFDEKNTCKQKYKTYLEKAKLILGYKKEMKEFSGHILEELDRITAQIRDYQVVVENIKVSLQAVILPEVSRRREFDVLNKQYTTFYWNWITQETESREKFIDTGDLQQLPLAFKKILVDLICDEAFEFEPRDQKTESFKDLHSLNAAMKSYFDRWSISPEASLKGKLEEYLRDNNSVRDELAGLSIQLEKAAKDRERLLKQLEEKDKEVSLLRSRFNGEEGIKNSYEQRISELTIELEAVEQDKQSLQYKCRNFSTEISSLVNQLNSKSAEIEACKKDFNFEVASLKKKLAEAEAEEQKSSTSFKQQIATLGYQLQSVTEQLTQKSTRLEAFAAELAKKKEDLTLTLEDRDRSLVKLQAELSEFMKDQERSTSVINLLKNRLGQQEETIQALESEKHSLKQAVAEASKEAWRDLGEKKQDQQVNDLLKEVSELKIKLEESEEIVSKLSDEKETVSLVLEDYQANFQKQEAICSSLEQEVLSLREELNKNTEAYEAKLEWCQNNHRQSGAAPKQAQEQNPSYEQLQADYNKLKTTVSINLNERIKAYTQRNEATLATIESRITQLDHSLEKLSAKHDSLKRNQLTLI